MKKSFVSGITTVTLATVLVVSGLFITLPVGGLGLIPNIALADVLENTLVLCTNGLDDNGDGFIDYTGPINADTACSIFGPVVTVDEVINGGTATDIDVVLSGTAEDTSPLPPDTHTSDPTPTDITIFPGTYTIGGTTLAGYTLTFSGDCDASGNFTAALADPAQNPSCTITADFIALAFANPAIVNLGEAGNFAVLSKTAISSIPTSVITGDVGISPAAGTAITGLTCPEVTGTVYGPVGEGGGSAAACIDVSTAYMDTVVGNMEAAYTDANNRISDATMDGDLGGETLTPGVYFTGSSLGISTDVTLDCSADADGVFIFQIGGGLSLAASTSIVLNGCQPGNIFWAVAGTTNIGGGGGTESTFVGTVLGGPGTSEITVITGSTVNGRLLGEKTIALQSNTITAPQGTVTGHKWNDLNNDGLWDRGDEPALAGWTIEILEGGTPVGSDVTDSQGLYSITISEGPYKLCEVQQSGWTQTYPTNTDGCHDVVVDAVPTPDSDYDFGNTRVEVPTTGTLIVQKVVINDDGGTATPSDFSFMVNGASTTAFESDGENQLTLNVGISYLITEVPAAGYTTTYESCNNTLVSPWTCIITNNDIEGETPPPPPPSDDGGGDSNRSGGGDGSNNLGRTDDNSVNSVDVNNGAVLGASITPGEVLGDQIAQLPASAPNAGGGGAAQGGLYGTLLMLTGLYGFIRFRKVQA